MLTREQRYALLMLKKRGDTFFSKLPMELIEEISTYDQDPNSAIGKALHHAAYAQKEDVTKLLTMLEANPRLLLEAGTVMTPGGDEVRRVTPYEFLLGAGDFELAEKVQSYFAKIENGESERIRQYECYRPHIEGILTQEPYNLRPLIQLIKEATAEETKALLDKDSRDENALCKAMNQFRKDWAPRILTKPCMHYNYKSLFHAFELIQDDKKWVDSSKESEEVFFKRSLLFRHVIGFEMRRLPGIDRCALAQGLHYVAEKNEAMARSYSLIWGPGGEFPNTQTDNSREGLGWDYAVSMLSGTTEHELNLAADCWETYIEQKTSKAQNLCDRTQYISNPLGRAGV